MYDLKYYVANVNGGFMGYVTGRGKIDRNVLADCPANTGRMGLRPEDFREVTEDAYDDWVLDLRYENGEWQQ